MAPDLDVPACACLPACLCSCHGCGCCVDGWCPTGLAALLVTTLFWTLLFPAIGHTTIEDVHCHAVNTLVVLIDLALSPLPFYFKHG